MAQLIDFRHSAFKQYRHLDSANVVDLIRGSDQSTDQLGGVDTGLQLQVLAVRQQEDRSRAQAVTQRRIHPKKHNSAS